MAAASGSDKSCSSWSLAIPASSAAARVPIPSVSAKPRTKKRYPTILCRIAPHGGHREHKLHSDRTHQRRRVLPPQRLHNMDIQGAQEVSDHVLSCHPVWQWHGHRFGITRLHQQLEPFQPSLAGGDIIAPGEISVGGVRDLGGGAVVGAGAGGGPVCDQRDVVWGRGGGPGDGRVGGS